MPSCVTLTFETKNHRLEWFAQVNLVSVGPTLQNLRIVHKKRQNGKSKVPGEAAWKLAKSVFKLKEHERAAFFSSPENRCLPASPLKPEEREFVVDSGASMHMISKKDLSNAEMDTLTKSCSPTIVITANGEVQTHEEATVYVKELEYISWQWKSSRIRQQFHRSESFAMNTDTLTIGSTDKKHISSTTVFWYSAIRRSSFRSWFQACQRVLPPVSLLQHLWHFQGRRLITLHLPQARLVHQPQLC